MLYLPQFQLLSDKMFTTKKTLHIWLWVAYLWNKIWKSHK